MPGPRRPTRGRGARLKALWAFLLRARKRPRCSLHNLELPRGASARRAFRRAERGASAWAVENRARAWPRVVCVCMCRCLCVRRVVCVSILGSLFWRPRSTQQPAASASERMRSTVGCDKNRPQKDWGLEKWPLRGLNTCVSSSAGASRRRSRVVFLWHLSEPSRAGGRVPPLAAVTISRAPRSGAFAGQRGGRPRTQLGHYERSPAAAADWPRTVQHNRSLRGAAREESRLRGVIKTFAFWGAHTELSRKNAYSSGATHLHSK